MLSTIAGKNGKRFIALSCSLWLLFYFYPQTFQAQNIQWVRQGTANTLHPHAVRLAPSGDIYIAGSFFNRLRIVLNLDSRGGEDIFLAKFSSEGVISWIRGAGSAESNEKAHDIAIGPDGTVYITGVASNGALFGTEMLQGLGDSEFFLAAYTPEGTLKWLRYSVSGTGTAEGHSLSIGEDGHLYVTGLCEVATFGNFTVMGNRSIFFASYTAEGDVRWIKKTSMAEQDNSLKKIHAAPDGEILLAGTFQQTMGIGGSITLQAGPGANQKKAVFAASFLASNGEVVWAQTLAYNNGDDLVFNDLDVNPQGQVALQVSASQAFIATRTNEALGGGSFIGLLDPAQGDTRFLSIPGCNRSDFTSGHQGGLRSDPEGNFYLVALSASGTLLSKFTPAGKGLGQQIIEGTAAQPNFPNDLAVGNQGNAFVLGLFRGVTNFGMAQVTASSANGDLYLARFTSGFITDVTPDASEKCDGAPITIDFVSSGTFNPDNQFIAQLSDENGDFFGATEIGRLAATQGGQLSGIIPQGKTPGNNYKIRVIATSPAVTFKCNETTLSITQGIQVDAGDNQEVCLGSGPVTLEGARPVGGKWSGTGIVDESGIFDPDLAGIGTFELRYEIEEGVCKGVDTRLITVIPRPQPPIFQADGPLDACEGTPVSFTTTAVPQASAYIWKRDSVEIARTIQPTFTTTLPGDYTLALATRCGEITSGNQITVLRSFPPDPFNLVIDGVLPLCEGQKIVLRGPETPGTTYLWQRNGQDLAEDGPTLDTEEEGVYILTLTNACGSTTNSNTVAITASPRANPRLSIAGEQTICPDTDLQLTLSFNGEHTFRWRKDNQLLSLNTLEASFSESGLYWAEVLTDCGVIRSDTLALTAVVLPAPPAIQASGTVLCGNTSASLQVSAIPGFTVQWLRNETLLPATGTSIEVDEPGTYTARFLSNCGNLMASNEIEVVVQPIPTAPVAPSVLRCGPGSATLLATAVATTVQFNWYDMETSDTPTATNTTGRFETPALQQTTTFFVAVVQGGCESPRTPVTVTVAPAVTANAGTDIRIRKEETAVLRASGGTIFRWTDLSGNTLGNGPELTVSPEETTTYLLEAANADGCTDTDQVTVFVDTDVVVPSAFSPNNDGINDLWEITGLSNFPDFEIRIFNRWGNTILTAKGGDFTWDGTLNGQPLPVDTYFYVLRLGPDNVLKGNVTIIK